MSAVALPTAIERIAQDLHESRGISLGNAAGVAIASVRALAKGRIRVRGVARNDARDVMTALAEAKLALGLRDKAVLRLESLEGRSRPMEDADLRLVAEHAQQRRTLSEGLLLASADDVGWQRARASACKLTGIEEAASDDDVLARLREESEADRVIAEMFAAAVGAAGGGDPAPTQPKPRPGSEDRRFEQLHPRNRIGRWIEKGEGMEGEPSQRVQMLQTRLAELGFRVNPDGRFGPVTNESVKAFQRTYGLEETGRVDASTIETLRNPPPKTAPEVEAEAAAAEKEKEGGKGGEKKDSATTANTSRKGGSAESRSEGRGAGGDGSSERNLNVDLADPKSVKAFQREHGLKATGDVDAATRAAITAVEHDRGSRSGTVSSRSGTVKQKGERESKGKGKAEGEADERPGDTMRQGDGMKGKPDPDVKEAQELLAALGFDLGEGGVDGRFGPDTRKAIVALQNKYGLEADGIIGPKTLRLLNRLKERRARQAKDKTAQASTDLLGAEMDEASYYDNAMVGGNVTGTLVPYGGAVPFILGAVAKLPEKQRPPDLHHATGWQACHNCIWFHAPRECMFYDYPVEEDDICDSYRTVTPEVAEMGRAEEALSRAEASGDKVAILAARERVQEARLPHMPHLIDWNPSLHPRNREGRFIDVLNKLGEGQGVRLPSGATVTKRGRRFHYLPEGEGKPNPLGGPSYERPEDVADHAIRFEAKKEPKGGMPLAKPGEAFEKARRQGPLPNAKPGEGKARFVGLLSPGDTVTGRHPVWGPVTGRVTNVKPNGDYTVEVTKARDKKAVGRRVPFAPNEVQRGGGAEKPPTPDGRSQSELEPGEHRRMSAKELRERGIKPVASQASNKEFADHVFEMHPHWRYGNNMSADTESPGVTVVKSYAEPIARIDHEKKTVTMGLEGRSSKTTEGHKNLIRRAAEAHGFTVREGGGAEKPGTRSESLEGPGTYEVAISTQGPQHKIEQRIRVEATGPLAAEQIVEREWRKTHGREGKFFPVDTRKMGKPETAKQAKRRVTGRKPAGDWTKNLPPEERARARRMAELDAKAKAIAKGGKAAERVKAELRGGKKKPKRTETSAEVQKRLGYPQLVGSGDEQIAAMQAEIDDLLVKPGEQIMVPEYERRLAKIKKLREQIRRMRGEPAVKVKEAQMSSVEEALAYDAVESLVEAEAGDDTLAIVRARARVAALDEAVLSYKARQNLPTSAFVFPKEKRYPIHDIAHARNALARSSGKPEEATVRAAVYKRYPELKPSEKKKAA